MSIFVFLDTVCCIALNGFRRWASSSCEGVSYGDGTVDTVHGGRPAGGERPYVQVQPPVRCTDHENQPPVGRWTHRETCPREWIHDHRRLHCRHHAGMRLPRIIVLSPLHLHSGICGGPFSWLIRKRVPSVLAVVIIIAASSPSPGTGAYMGQRQQLPPGDPAVSDPYRGRIHTLHFWLRGSAQHLSTRRHGFLRPGLHHAIIANI
jgi:hypothetical protein